MSGAFYGSLAASASVFVAILTALLVNNYVQIKADRRQTKNELERIEEDLEGLKERRDDYQETVDGLIEKREADYREKAEKQVNEFIESEVPAEVSKPIEKLTVDELYQKLIGFHDCESAEDLEESPLHLHHRDVLEERIGEIENQVLNSIVPSFASKYEGKGWNTNFESDFTSLVEAMEEKQDNDEGDEEQSGNEDDEDPDIDVKAERLRRDPLTLDEFVEKYKEEHGLDSLDDKTRDALDTQYDNVVDKNPNPSPSSLSSSLNSGPFSSLQPGFMDAALAASQAGSFDDSLYEMDLPSVNSVIGLSVQEQQKLEKTQENLRNKENEIATLEHRRGRLEREKERLHPEDLNSTLYANVLTILLSVVVPIAAYLDTVTEFTISQLQWVNIWMIAGSWFLGLVIVFLSIYVKINNNS
jgi:hypothetical protein